MAWHDIAALINLQKAVISLAEFVREPFWQIPSHVSKLYMAAAVKCKIAHYIWSQWPHLSGYFSCKTNQNMRLQRSEPSVAATPIL